MIWSYFGSVTFSIFFDKKNLGSSTLEDENSIPPRGATTSG
jgi:hypothetical protein